MSAADRIEAVVVDLEHYHEDGEEEHQDCAPCEARADLRAIAAELRGAPALTETERAFFEAALALKDWDMKMLTNAEAHVLVWDRGEELAAQVDSAYRALRTERTPSEEG